MPYMVQKEGEDFHVYKQGEDGKPTGDSLGKHATEKEAQDQMAAIHANEDGKKDMDDIAMPMKLWPDDSRVQYSPMGGMGGEKACANCQWFIAASNKCCVVEGDIVPTGLSKLWLGKPELPPFDPNAPLKVEIVADNSKEAPVEKPGFFAQIKAFLAGEKAKGITSGFKSLPNHKWVAFYSNNFADRQNEVFTEKAHDAYIAALDSKAIPMPQLWRWHVPGSKGGQADWVGRIDHIMVAVGHYDETPAGKAYEAYYSGKGSNEHVSHGFFYPKSALQDGVFHAYRTFEISPLPQGRAANPYTSFENLSEVKEMALTEEKRKDLEAILGKELAAQIITTAENGSKEIEALGVKFKETPALPGADTEAREAVKALAADHVATKTAVDAYVAAVKEVTGKIDQLLVAVKAIQEGETARNTKVDQANQRVEQIASAVKEVFELQPSPRQAKSTAIADDNPLLQALRSKQLEGEQPDLGVFGKMGLDGLFKTNP